MLTLGASGINERLLETDAHLAPFGWDLPNYLFALTGDRCESELWMEVAGPAEEFLAALEDLGLRTGPDVQGLMLVLTHNPWREPEHLLLDLPVLGGLQRICRQANVPPEVLLERVRERAVRVPRPVGTPIRAVMAILRNGETFVVVREEDERVRTVMRLPALLGDHDVLAALALRLLSGSSPLRGSSLGWRLV